MNALRLRLYDDAGRLYLPVIDGGALCCNCGQDTLAIGEFYMVHSHVWSSSGMCPCGVLCIGCLEARLGRQLTAADFIDCLINDLGYRMSRPRSPRLVSRLRAGGPADTGEAL